MKKFILSTIVWVVSVLIAFAGPVSEQAAKKAAQEFIRQQLPAMTRGEAAELTRAVTGVADGDDAGVFVFNASKGYVVMSADDELPAVLAYGNGAPYDAETAAPALKFMLEAYHMAATTNAFTRASVPTHSDVSPMINTQWDQDAPYNLLCPVDESTGKISYTGCVATAMSQIMYYHKWPASYDWDQMKTTYKESDTGASANAVAKLMADAGSAAFMSYSSSFSGATTLDACEALRYDFGYAETTDLVDRAAYTSEEWDALIYSELSDKRPVFYGAIQVTSDGEQLGHAFIIDGYEVKSGTGYFHVNWGWSGRSDDYFLISVLNPRQQYAGGAAGTSGYSISQEAIVGIQPAAEPLAKTTRFYTEDVCIENDKGTYERASVSVDFPGVKIGCAVYNVASPGKNRDYDLAFAICKGYETVKILDKGSIKDVIGSSLGYQKGVGIVSDFISFGKDLADGKYQIRILSRETGTTEWTWAMGGTAYYVDLNISGTKMTTTTHGYFVETDLGDFKVNSVTVSESPLVGEPMTITINLTDKNKYSNAPIYLWGNASPSAGSDSYQLLGGIGTNLDPGETGDVVMEYTPQRGGSFTFILSSSMDNCNSPLYTFTAEVGGMYIELKDVTVDGAEPQSDGTNKVDGTTLKGYVKLSNYGAGVYDNYVIFELVGTASLGTGLKRIDKKTESSNIAIGETKDIPFGFENLQGDFYYILLITVVDGGTNIPLNYISDGDYITYYKRYIYYLTGGTDHIFATDAEAADADVYNMNGVLMGKASGLKMLPKGVYIINKKKIINR